MAGYSWGDTNRYYAQAAASRKPKSKPKPKPRSSVSVNIGSGAQRPASPVANIGSGAQRPASPVSNIGWGSQRPASPTGGIGSGSQRPAQQPTWSPAPTSTSSAPPPLAPQPSPFPTTPPAAPVAPAPVYEDVKIPGAASDPGYLLTLASLKKARNAYEDTQDLQRKQYEGGFTEAQDLMGYDVGANGKRGWNADPFGGAYGEAIYNNSNDFTSRGLGFSGLYDYANAKLNQEFQNRLNTMIREEKDFRDTATRAHGTFVGQQEDARLAALLNAQQRIAEKLQLEASQVPRGSTGTTLRREKA